MVEEHVIRQVPPPKPERMEIVPFTGQDIQLMLLTCEHSKIYRRNGQLTTSSASRRETLLAWIAS